ncbi:MAG: class I SAM-dependent methyltransferase [Magnetospirillum sp.]|nr:class I SAM-dependent methyltransferase [Magnetospirillum sp.]
MSASLPPCALCGQSAFELRFPGNIGDDIGSRFSQYAYYDDIYRCRVCGLVVQHRRHDPATIAGLLKAEKYLDEAIGELNLREKHVQFETLLGLVETFRPLEGQRVLDVGANTGLFLSMARRKAASVRGVEPSREAAENARRTFGLDVQDCLIAEADLPDAAFDMVTLFDVVEHLTDPAGDLAFLARKVAPGGLLFLSTHDIGTWLARLSGPGYPMLMYQHFFHFTPHTLGLMVEKAGFKVLGHRRFLKSWSVEYIYNLIEKKWPGSRRSRLLRAVLAPLVSIDSIRRARITSPQRDFFILAAERLPGAAER